MTKKTNYTDEPLGKAEVTPDFLPSLSEPACREEGTRMTPPMPPFSVKRIDHLVFRVRDLQTSVAFYSAVLGCEAIRTRDDLGLVHLRAGASMIDLISIDGKLGRMGGAGPSAGVGGRNVDHLCLRIEPFIEEALTLHLKQHGIVPHAKASTNFGAEGEGLSLYFDDPDGNVIELKGGASVQP
jgi:glyoxylase I family protein